MAYYHSSPLFTPMGFALWIEDDLAWAQGLHEYRPMGAAVIALGDRFRPRDFGARRPPPERGSAGYDGLYASLGEVNARLNELRSQARAKKGRRNRRPTPAWV